MSLDARPGRRLLVAAAVLGLLLRLAFSFLYWVGKPLTHDEREYLELARSLAAGRGFVYSESYDSGTAQQFGRAPGYPLFLAATGAGRAPADGVPASVKISQAAVGAVAAILGKLGVRTRTEAASTAHRLGLIR